MDIDKTSYSFMFEIDIEGYNLPIETEKYKHILIHQDFINNRYPIMMITFMMDAKDFYKLSKLYNSDKPILDNITLKISSINDNDDTDRYKELIIYDEYLGIINNTKGISDKEALAFEIETSGQHTMNSVYEVKISLFNKNELTAFNKGISNNVFKSASLIDVMSTLFTECVNDQLLFSPSPPHNTTSYDQLLLPPHGFLDGLKFLQKDFNLYNYPYNVYVRDKTVYMYPILGPAEIEHKDKVKNRKLVITVTDAIEVTLDEELIESTPDIVNIALSRDKVTVGSNYNPLKKNIIGVTLETLTAGDNDGYEFIHNVEAENFNYNVSNNSKSVKVFKLNFSLSKFGHDLIIYPHTIVEVVHEKLGGIYRIRECIEVFNKDGFSKVFDIYKVKE